jgi:hypothetical protein
VSADHAQVRNDKQSRDTETDCGEVENSFLLDVVPRNGRALCQEERRMLWALSPRLCFPSIVSVMLVPWGDGAGHTLATAHLAGASLKSRHRT